jgi:uncharacterized membrane protein
MSVLITVMPGQFSGELKHFREIPGLGILIVLAVIGLTGVLAINFAGQWWLKVWDRSVTRIPVVRSIYSSVKQVSSTLFSGKNQSFRKALLIRYPHVESWVIAFQTGVAAPEISSKLGGEYVNVFLPTTPNPTSGFFMIVPRANVIELEMSVQEALKHIVSMGSVAPRSAMVSSSQHSPNHLN